MRAVMSTVSSDVLAWRAQTGVDRFDEMWEGVLHMNAAPHGDHQLLQDDLREWLKRWWARPQKALAVCQRNVAKPEEWPKNYRIPDIVLLPQDRQHFDRGKYIAGPPLVAIEIRRPDDDSYDKLPFYLDFGIPEVWIIDRNSKSAEIFVESEVGYSPAEKDESGWITSPNTNIKLRLTDQGMLAIQLIASQDSLAELPETM